ncbi:capsule polysaccharide biosynthesis domain protein [Candidatus Magnetomorum sp. HK-1]|nr:capsule polysaccharide biosynthesis domain protein [Candidatus Magnetomorum sp. HK-1]
MKKKILFFAPYANWLVHHQVDAVLAYSLSLRGADVNVITCDSVFKNCPLAFDSNKIYKQTVCTNCKNNADIFFGSFNLPTIKLSSLLTQKDTKDCYNWVNNQIPQSYSHSIFEGNEIGKWILAGVHSFYLSGSLDYSDQHVLKLYQSFLLNGALLTRALEKVFDQWSPDFVVSFQSILSYYRVCFEFSKKRNIPVLVHERGLIDGSFNFILNENQAMSKGIIKASNRWKKIPLSLDECKTIINYFSDRESGKNLNIRALYSFSDEAINVRNSLRIPYQAKIVALITSADWENAMTSEFCASPFKSQVEYLKHHINIFSSRKEYLVIRHHPNIVQKTHMDKAFIKEMIKISQSLPENVRMIMPNEKISSYALLWNADACITFGSTIGFESYLRGVASISYRNIIHSAFDVGLDFINESTNCQEMIDRTISKSNQLSFKDIRPILRVSYFYFFRLSLFFKSFGIKDFYKHDFRFKQLSDLQAGFDPQLDNICDYILGKHNSLYPLPDKEQEIRSEHDETNFLKQLFNDIQQKRHLIQNNSIKCENCNIQISVICVLQENNYSEKTDSYIYKSIKTSRHNVCEILYETIQSSIVEIAFIQSLIDLVKTAKGDIIYIGTENVQLDESFLSSSVDFLGKEENNAYDGVITGAWILENDIISDEIFTNRKFIQDFGKLKKYFVHPAQLLSFIVWKKGELLAFLSMVNQSCSDISAEIFHKTLSKNAANFLHKYRIPMITIHNPNNFTAEMNVVVDNLKSLITVVRIRQNGIREPHDTPFYKSLNQSDHSLIEVKSNFELSFPFFSNIDNFINELIASANNAKGKFVYFASDNIEIHPSLFSEAIEFLNQSENASFDAIIPGVKVWGNDGKLEHELFTFPKVMFSYDNIVEAFPFFKNPAYIFSLCVFRTSSLIRLLFKYMDRVNSFEQLSSTFYDLFFYKNDFRFHRIHNFFLKVLVPLNAIELMKKGIQCIKKQGQEIEALSFFEKAMHTRETVKDLGYYRALTKLKRSKYWEAYIIAKEQINDFPEDSKTNQLLLELNGFVYNKEIKYKDISSCISTVEGYISSSNEVFLFNKVKSLHSTANIMEIGALYGRSSVSMGFACIGTDKHIFSMDTFLGNVYGGTRKKGNSFFDLWYRNILRFGLKKYFTPLQGFSHKLLLEWENKPFLDFVFIDASHHYKDVIKDFELVYPLVKDNGWIAFHDVSPDWPGSWRVWRETAMHLLDCHEYDPNLACGKKVAGRKFVKPSSKAQFDFSMEWAKDLENKVPQISDAMKTILLAESNTASNFEQADAIIATMNNHLKFSLREMLKLEASVDPYLHYFNALTFIYEKKYKEAIDSFIQSKQCSYNLNVTIQEKINLYLNKLNKTD